LEQQHTLTEKAWSGLRDVVAAKTQPGQVKKRDRAALDNLYGTLNPVGRESFVEFPETLMDAKRMVEGLNEAIAAKRQQEVRTERAQQVRTVMQAARYRAAGARADEEIALINAYDSPTPPKAGHAPQISDASGTIQIGMEPSENRSPSPQRRGQLPSRFSADSSDVDDAALRTGLYPSSSNSSDRSDQARKETRRSGRRR
jgi:hypothetical protein